MAARSTLVMVEGRIVVAVDGRILPTLGPDRQLHIAILDIEHGIGFVALCKNGLTAPVFLSGRLSADALG
jgi:hypothetical protein